MILSLVSSFWWVGYLHKMKPFSCRKSLLNKKKGNNIQAYRYGKHNLPNCIEQILDLLDQIYEKLLGPLKDCWSDPPWSSQQIKRCHLFKCDVT